jgi:hypothetical protein
MRDLLRILALAVVAGSLMAWLSLGPNLGWTKTSITKWQRDPVTQIDGPVIERRFVPGIDLLALCVLSGTLLFILSSLKWKSPTPNPEVDSP